MARKYGSKKFVTNGLNNYLIGLLGESGIGKSTLIKNVCEKEFGDEGYLFINCGQESNIIDGIVETDAKDFKTVIDIVNDITANRTTDYADLKVVVFDTLDQLFSIAEVYTVAMWNKENQTTPNFKKQKDISGCYGGFDRGFKRVIATVLSVFSKLKEVGISPWYIGHVKTKELTDPITGGTYSKLTTNMTNRYFEAVKEKTNLIGIAAIDRTIEIQSTGKKNIMTHKDITINRVINERRKVSFRDSNFIIDAKSQFPHIVNEIPLDADEFIKAIKDAIEAAKSENSSVAQKINNFNEAVLEAKEELKHPKQEDNSSAVDDDEVDAVDVLDEDAPVDDDIAVDVATDDDYSSYPEDLMTAVAGLWKTCKDTSVRTEVKTVMNGHKLSELDNVTLRKMYDILNK